MIAGNELSWCLWAHAPKRVHTNPPTAHEATINRGSTLTFAFAPPTTWETAKQMLDRTVPRLFRPLLCEASLASWARSPMSSGTLAPELVHCSEKTLAVSVADAC